MIGAGIFSSIGTAAVGEVAADGTVVRYGAGSALTLSFLLLGGVCVLAGLCYAELTALIPISGSAYTYACATLGELVAWMIGWDLILEYAVGNVAVAIAWSGYFTSLLRAFGVPFPFWLSHSYRDVAASSCSGFRRRRGCASASGSGSAPCCTSPTAEGTAPAPARLHPPARARRARPPADQQQRPGCRGS